MTYLWSLAAGLLTGPLCTAIITSAFWCDRPAERERRWRTQGRHCLRL